MFEQNECLVLKHDKQVWLWQVSSYRIIHAYTQRKYAWVNICQILTDVDPTSDSLIFDLVVCKACYSGSL